MKLEQYLNDHEKSYELYGGQIIVHGNVSLYHLNDTVDLPEALYTFDLDLEGQSEIYNLPTELYVFESLDITKTNISEIPPGTWVSETIYTSRTALQHLDDFYVNGFFTTHGVIS